MEVDAVVRDRRGVLVHGLTQNDFELFEDGKPVPIAGFTAIDLPFPELVGAPTRPDTSGSALGTNDYSQDGRLFLLVIDDFHIRFGGNRTTKTLRIARRFIDRLGAGDLAAVVSTSSRHSLSVEFTGDKTRLRHAVETFLPAGEEDETVAPADPRNPVADSAETFAAGMKARFAMDRLSGVAHVLSLVPHRRKTVVFISEGLPYSIEDVMSANGRAAADSGDALAALRDFIRTAEQSDIAVYTFDVSDVESGSTPRTRSDNLRTIAENTGGTHTANTADEQSAVDRMVEENGAYYLLAYESPANPSDGKHHQISVRVRKDGLNVRAREGYTAVPSTARVRSGDNSIGSLVAAPVQSRGLPIRTAAVPVPAVARDGAAIAVAAELPASTLMNGGGFEIIFSAVNVESGKIAATDRVEMRATRDPGGAAGWVRVASRLNVQPGGYQVRVAARTIDGAQRGAVFTEVEVPKTRGALTAGGFYLGTVTANAIHRQALIPLIPAIPIASPDVPAGLSLVAVLPVSVDKTRQDATLVVVTTVEGPDGSVTEVDRSSQKVAAFARSGGAYMVSLPKLIGNGAYRVLVVARLDGDGPLTRAVAFRILPEKR